MTAIPLRVLVLGGYGQFGERICRITQTEVRRRGLNVQLVVAGRNQARADRLVRELNEEEPVELWPDFRDGRPSMRHEFTPHEPAVVDVHAPGALADALACLKPALVVHTVGPFQGQDFAVARTCVDAGCHYVDISDSRAWVADFVRDEALRELAVARGVVAVAGLSTVPSVTVACVDDIIGDFAAVDSIRAGISVSGKARPGEATIRGILGYAGKPFSALENGAQSTRYGWQNLHRHRFPPPYGLRWQGRCDVPELDALPERYGHLGLQTVDFHAGLENAIPHLGAWLGSWAVRCGVLSSLGAYAGPLERLKTWLSNNVLTDTYLSVMYVEVKGRRRRNRRRDGTATSVVAAIEEEEEEEEEKDRETVAATTTLNLLVASRTTERDPRQQRYYAKVGDHYQGDGPNIPCIPSVLFMRRLVADEEEDATRRRRHQRRGRGEEGGGAVAAAECSRRPAGTYRGLDFFSFGDLMDLASSHFDIVSSVERREEGRTSSSEDEFEREFFMRRKSNDC